MRRSGPSGSAGGSGSGSSSIPASQEDTEADILGEETYKDARRVTRVCSDPFQSDPALTTRHTSPSPARLHSAPPSSAFPPRPTASRFRNHGDGKAVHCAARSIWL
jgi:hypothetical protein